MISSRKQFLPSRFFFHSSKKGKSRTGIQGPGCRVQTLLFSTADLVYLVCCPFPKAQTSLLVLCLHHTRQEMNQVAAEAPANPHIPPSPKEGEATLSEGEVGIYPQWQPPTLGHLGVTTGQPEHLDLAVTLQEPWQITSGMCFSFQSNKWKHWTR